MEQWAVYGHEYYQNNPQVTNPQGVPESFSIPNQPVQEKIQIYRHQLDNKIKSVELVMKSQMQMRRVGAIVFLALIWLFVLGRWVNDAIEDELIFLFCLVTFLSILTLLLLHSDYFLVKSVIKHARVSEDLGDYVLALALLKTYSTHLGSNTTLSQEFKHINERVEILTYTASE